MRNAATLESILTKDKRGRVVYNLLETEQNYTAQLEVMQNYFYSNLVSKQIITEHSANLIFYGICIFELIEADLHDFHMMFYKKLEILVSTWDQSKTKIGALFIQHVI